ncbi:MAG: hypothetical protein IJX49_04975 [Clostridia bacterium]|nr:hypothetical protein [Clostridia bacterium]
MEERRVKEFKVACREYFSTVSLNFLRSYGRYLQLHNPTAINKKALIEEIVRVLCGESFPKRKSVGAPVKDDHVEMRILEKVAELKREYLGEEEIPFSAPLQKEEEGKKENETPCCVQLVFNISDLTDEQKRLLNVFLASFQT